ncbi:MAG: hypothetical protein WCW04_01205 [Candidatus Paceibacterota bacterium]
MKEIKQIKDFKIALKDMEPYVKDPTFLLKGREFTNFLLRPREAWANWLLCAVLRKLHGDNITFTEDPKGDGFILDKNTGEFIPTEHISALENTFNKLPKGESRIINAINQKIKKGPEYAKGKWLVVFFDGAEKFFRNKIRENIKGRHNFGAVYCIGLLTSENGYVYSITEFKESSGNKSITFKVKINSDFTDWKISQVKQ